MNGSGDVSKRAITKSDDGLPTPAPLYGMTDLNDNATSEKAQFAEDDKAHLSEAKRRVSTQTAAQLRIATLVVSWLSVIVLSILGLITLVVAIIDKSSASFAFALDALLDCMSSIVVIWRYNSAEALYNRRKEKLACIALGILFLCSFVSVIVQSSISISHGRPHQKADIIWYLAIVNAVVCLFLFSAKAYLARQLESISIATDAVNSAIGFLLAVATFVGDIVYLRHPRIWYIDPTLGLICSVFLLIYGIWIIVYEVKLSSHSQEYTNMDG